MAAGTTIVCLFFWLGKLKERASWTKVGKADGTKDSNSKVYRVLYTTKYYYPKHYGCYRTPNMKSSTYGYVLKIKDRKRIPANGDLIKIEHIMVRVDNITKLRYNKYVLLVHYAGTWDENQTKS